MHLCHDDMVGLINVKHFKHQPDMLEVKRLSITWDQITFSPAWVIPPSLYSKYQIPNVFSASASQFTFVADNRLFITKDDRIAMLELL